jgi:hypothetical protein
MELNSGAYELSAMVDNIHGPFCVLQVMNISLNVKTRAEISLPVVPYDPTISIPFAWLLQEWIPGLSSQSPLDYEN